jgi:PBP1b-binding outer membrane lipoprotein LpoB
MNKGLRYAIVVAGALALSACASMSGKPPSQVKLKDGSSLSIDRTGNMIMYDKDGKPMEMVDGLPMEAEDGSIVMMKNNALYRRIGNPK